MGHICHSALTEPEIAVALSQDRLTDRSAGETSSTTRASLCGFCHYLRKLELVGWGTLLA